MVVQHSDHASEDQVQSRQWAVLRAFMDPKEAALLDSLLSSRTLNPDITVFPLHFAAAEGLCLVEDQGRPWKRDPSR